MALQILLMVETLIFYLSLKPITDSYIVEIV